MFCVEFDWRYTYLVLNELVLFSSRRRHTRCALVTGVQTCALPIFSPTETNPFPKSIVSQWISFAMRSYRRESADTLDLAPRSTTASRTHRPRGNVMEIGRASCRARECQYVEISVVAVSIKKKMTTNISEYRRQSTTKFSIV